MARLNVAMYALAMLCSSACQAQSPQCADNRYGTPAQAVAIEDAMLDGDTAAVVATIRAAQATRGVQLGCPEVASSYVATNTSPVPAAAVRASWPAHAGVALPAQYTQCPPFGREMGAYALGLWAAREAGAVVDEARARSIADGFVDVQYLPTRTPGELRTWPGIYPYSTRYASAGDSCYVGGVIETGLAMACGGQLPDLCVRYRNGPLAGQQFAVGDFSRTPRVYDGGAGFDQGWAGVMMAQAAVSASDPAARARYLASLRAAAEWALAEPPVRNHNYTAKLVWLLAATYDLTGETRWRDGMLDKLERNLLPGVLMDFNADGEIDGVPGIGFSALVAPAARMPGRMWDAHNARPEYQAMNAWALAQAYVALRDRGDAVHAARVRPYAIATLDNLAAEVLSLGAPGADAPGTSQPPFALLTGLRAIADAENLPKPDWERAAAVFWHRGVATAPGGVRTSILALFLQRAEGIAWRSLGARSARQAASGVSGAWFDPARSGEGLLVFISGNGRGFATWFTFDAADPTRQLWLFGAGTFDGDRLLIDAVFRAEGTRFGAAFDPAAVRLVDWGRLEFRLGGCRDAQLLYAARDPAYGAGTRTLRKLAGVAGSGCE
jgi:hypothetical protein